MWLKALCEDLAHLSDAELAYGSSRIRQANPPVRFFPTSGQIIAACKPPFADPPTRSQGRQTDHGFQPWGGACQCDACMKKTPREGFFRATNADYARDAAERDRLDYAMEQKLGHDPKVGNPELDNTVGHQRTPEEFANAVASARAKYPRVFNPGISEWTAPAAPIAYMPMTPERKNELLTNLDRRIAEGNPG